MMPVRWNGTTLLIAGAGLVACAAVAAPAAKAVSVKWPGGTVSAGKIDWKARQAKLLLVFSQGVRATAQLPNHRIELEHADRATADVASGRRFSTIKANGSVRFSIERKSGGQVERANARCRQATIHNPEGKKLAGDERFLVADLVGDVLLTLPAPKAAGAKADGPAEPMTLEGEHGQVWLTADGGYEGSVSGAD